MNSTIEEPETAFDPPPATQEASDAAVPALADDHPSPAAAPDATVVPDGPEAPPQAEVPFPTPDDDGGAYYWDAATMAPLNAASAVST